MLAAVNENAAAGVLTDSPLFEPLPDGVLAELSTRLLPVAFPAGATILHEGDTSDEAYFIRRGKVAVGTTNLVGQQVVLAVLGRGDTFGEGGLVTVSTRTATVSALTQVEAYKITRAAFAWLCSRDPDFADRARAQFDLLQIDRFLKQASPFA